MYLYGLNISKNGIFMLSSNQANFGKHSKEEWKQMSTPYGVRAHHKTTTVYPRMQKLHWSLIASPLNNFQILSPDDCKLVYLLSEFQHFCSIQELERAFFDLVNMEITAQKVLSLMKNSCINQNYL